MSYTSWPAGLPQRPLPGMSRSPQRNKVSFQPEIGPSIDRRRGSSSVHIIQMAFDLTSFDMVTEFENWFHNDLLDGIEPFLWEDPVDGNIYVWKFASEDPPYDISSQRGTYSELKFKLTRLYSWNG